MTFPGRYLAPTLALFILILATGCRTPEIPLRGIPTMAPTAEPPHPEQFLPTEGIAGTRSLAYDIGTTIITQSRAPSELAEMPIPLIGTISVPEGEGPFPVAIVLHGRHPRCYADVAQLEEIWPCPPDTEPRYDSGFSYLLDSLSASGYLAIAPSVNGAYSTSYGLGQPSLDEAQPWIDERMTAIIRAHLDGLAAAGNGEPVFGEFLDLTGKVDGSNVALIAHSTSGITANGLAREGTLPVRALLLLASMHFEGTGPTADVPTAVLLPACDGDRPDLPAQTFFEDARLESGRVAPIVSILLDGANHNFFNAELARQGIDDATFVRNPDCAEVRLSAEQQQAFLADLATDLVQFGFERGEQPVFLNPSIASPSELYGRDVQVSLAPPSADRRQLFVPPTSATTVPPGTATGPLELVTCSPAAACVPGMLQPGAPGQYRLSWAGPGAVYKLDIPAGVLGADTLRLRLALDPTHPLNTAGTPIAFHIAVTDADGNRSAVELPEPLPFPSKAAYPGDEYRFTPVLPRDIRLPLTSFSGIDSATLMSVELVFDMTPTGSILLSDLDLLHSMGE